MTFPLCAACTMARMMLVIRASPLCVTCVLMACIAECAERDAEQAVELHWPGAVQCVQMLLPVKAFDAIWNWLPAPS